jgi:hypothetical protein
MAGIKAAEVSAILKKQLSGFEATASLDEVGTVLQVGDGIARVYGLSNAQYGELVEFEGGLEGIVLNLEEDNVGVVLLGPSQEVMEGATVKRTQRISSIKVGEGIVGRVVDTLGNPIDGKGALTGELLEMPLERKAPGVIFRKPRFVLIPLSTRRNSTMRESPSIVFMLQWGKKLPQWPGLQKPWKTREPWPTLPSWRPTHQTRLLCRYTLLLQEPLSESISGTQAVRP